jgi:hypothetical protein
VDGQPAQAYHRNLAASTEFFAGACPLPGEAAKASPFLHSVPALGAARSFRTEELSVLAAVHYKELRSTRAAAARLPAPDDRLNSDSDSSHTQTHLILIRIPPFRVQHIHATPAALAHHHSLPPPPFTPSPVPRHSSALCILHLHSTLHSALCTALCTLHVAPPVAPLRRFYSSLLLAAVCARVRIRLTPTTPAP